MVKSMTGFGKSQTFYNGYQVSIELKGVNHRYLDFYIRTSRRYSLLEEKIKEEIKKNISRGRIEISINIEKTQESSRKIKLDKELAMAYHKSLKDLAHFLQISPEFKLIDLYRLPEVYNLADEEEDLEVLWLEVQKALKIAIQEFVEMRKQEGISLSEDIKNRISLILQKIEILEVRAPIVVEDYREKLQIRLQQVINSELIDEQRILMEAALFAEKVNITEEIVRLKSHIKQLLNTFDNNDSIGKKCDFLTQEMFREANTIASKANDFEMSKNIVEVKAELEKIREQIQNIE